ncbi:MAG: hypothetical protein MUC49_16370 [Raineya sp.]|jgi:CRP-like cAMP-binding protein|nr:hypothetical protein [Raineya sp.]
MLAKKLKEIFDFFIELDLQVWQNFSELGEVQKYPKESIIKQAYTTEKFLNILLRGCGGNLIWNKNNFVCIDISFENDSLMDYMSFATQNPSPIEVRLFEDSEIFRVSYKNFQKTFLEGNFGEKVTRLTTQYSYFQKQQQQIDLLTKTAKERYLDLLALNKDASRIPLKYLASYLGITPQSLSRIRAQKI